MDKDKKELPTEDANALINKESHNSDIEKEIENFIQEAPPEIRRTVSALMMRTSSGSFHQHPLFDKFTSEHIDKFLDLNEEDNKRAYYFACSSRWFAFGYGFLILTFLLFLIVYLLPNNKDLLIDILKLLVSFAGGFGAGYGWKSKK